MNTDTERTARAADAPARGGPRPRHHPGRPRWSSPPPGPHPGPWRTVAPALERRSLHYRQDHRRRLVAHAAPITGVGDGEIHGREALKQWVAVGSIITFTSNDTHHVVDGMLVEYWANADSRLSRSNSAPEKSPGTRG